jgi:ribosome-binding protein aMBF1 (putative translation factor)
MKLCDWCDEEIENNDNEAKVVGSKVSLCNACYTAYDNVAINELTKRKKW